MVSARFLVVKKEETEYLKSLIPGHSTFKKGLEKTARYHSLLLREYFRRWMLEQKRSPPVSHQMTFLLGHARHIQNNGIKELE